MKQMFGKSIQMKCLTLPLLVLVCTAALSTGCKGRSHGSPDGYNLERPQTAELGKVLNEISGLSWDNENQALVAISDSKEKLFLIGLKNKKLKDLTGKVLPADADTEDVIVTDSCYYVLSSWGEIRKIPLSAQDTSGMQSFRIPLEGKNDFEAMYYDPTAKGIVMLCKKCELDKGTGQVSAFRFDASSGRFDSSALFVLNDKEVEALLKDADAKLNPSAAAIHPYNKRLYILSSAGNLLVVTDTRGKVVEAFQLNPDRFPQSEGIAFAPNGDMYISNEGKYGKPTLLHFPYQMRQQNKDKKEKQ
jgi:uncharacterized protein YjiK